MFIAINAPYWFATNLEAIESTHLATPVSQLPCRSSETAFGAERDWGFRTPIHCTVVLVGSGWFMGIPSNSKNRWSPPMHWAAWTPSSTWSWVLKTARLSTMVLCWRSTICKRWTHQTDWSSISTRSTSSLLQPDRCSRATGFTTSTSQLSPSSPHSYKSLRADKYDFLGTHLIFFSNLISFRSVISNLMFFFWRWSWLLPLWWIPSWQSTASWSLNPIYSSSRPWSLSLSGETLQQPNTRSLARQQVWPLQEAPLLGAAVGRNDKKMV